jgi:hypothetical protein
VTGGHRHRSVISLIQGKLQVKFIDTDPVRFTAMKFHLYIFIFSRIWSEARRASLPPPVSVEFIRKFNKTKRAQGTSTLVM